MKKSMQIEGMSCHHCVHAVRQALSAVEGIQVDHVEIGLATVTCDSNATDFERAKAAVEEEGYPVVGEVPA
jgi:copper chaperone CopZ